MAAVNKMIESIVTLVIGAYLVPVLVSAIDQANVSGSTKLMLDLIPFFFAIGLLYYAISHMRAE